MIPIDTMVATGKEIATYKPTGTTQQAKVAQVIRAKAKEMGLKSWERVRVRVGVVVEMMRVAQDGAEITMSEPPQS